MSKKQTPTSTDVGANVLDELNELAGKVTALTGKPPALSGTDIRRSTKLRKGGETVIPTLAALAKQFGLTISSHPTKTMVANMAQAQSLIPIHRKLVATTKQVGDTIFQAHSESWAAASVHYQALRGMASQDGDVAKTLAPVKQFFAKRTPTVVEAGDEKRGGRKGTKKAKPSKSSSEATAAVETPGTPESPATATSPAAATPTATPSPASISAPHS